MGLRGAGRLQNGKHKGGKPVMKKEEANAHPAGALKVRMRFSEKICTASIEELALSVRGYNCLRRNGIGSMGELIDAINEGKPEGYRNLGKKTLREIKQKLVAYGYSQMDEEGRRRFFRELGDINNMSSEV